MKAYQSALIALRSSGTPAAKQNKFAKLSVEAQDPMFKELTSRVSFVYKHYMKPGWTRLNPQEGMPNNFDEWRTLRDKTTKELNDYCEFILSQQKPEWQVTAEKKGWVYLTPELKEKLGIN